MDSSRPPQLAPRSRWATIEGVIKGTPAYMAPEMALGDHVDARADLYALGCVAYYLLTGEQVFTRDTVLKVITQHLQAVPVPPSERTELPIPTTLEHLVLACLAKKPEEHRRTRDNWRCHSTRLWDDVGRGGGDSMVEPASSTAGVDIRRDYALNRRRLCRHRPRDRAGRVTDRVVRIVVMDGPP